MMLLDPGVSLGRQRLVREYAAWMGAELNTRADLTLRCRATLHLPNNRRLSVTLNADFLNATVVRAFNRLNGYALGVRRTGSQARLDALVWSERGAAGGRPHIHALVERPQFVGEDQFRNMFERAWRAQPFAYREAQIEAVRDLERSIGYDAKNSPAVTGNFVYFHREPRESAWWRVSEARLSHP